MRSVVLAVSVTLAAACGSSPTAPSPGPPSGPRTGTWVGSLTDPSNGQGALRVDLHEAALGASGLLAGTWSATFGDPSKNARGEVSGGVTGSAVQLILRPTEPLTCPNPGPVPITYGSYFALNLAIAGAAISGPYTYQGCTGAVNGALTLTRQ